MGPQSSGSHTWMLNIPGSCLDMVCCHERHRQLNTKRQPLSGMALTSRSMVAAVPVLKGLAVLPMVSAISCNVSVEVKLVRGTEDEVLVTLACVEVLGDVTGT